MAVKLLKTSAIKHGNVRALVMLGNLYFENLDNTGKPLLVERVRVKANKIARANDKRTMQFTSTNPRG